MQTSKRRVPSAAERAAGSKGSVCRCSTSAGISGTSWRPEWSMQTAKPRARRPFTMKWPVGPVPPITSERTPRLPRAPQRLRAALLLDGDLLQAAADLVLGHLDLDQAQAPAGRALGDGAGLVLLEGEDHAAARRDRLERAPEAFARAGVVEAASRAGLDHRAPQHASLRLDGELDVGEALDRVRRRAADGVAAGEPRDLRAHDLHDKDVASLVEAHHLALDPVALRRLRLRGRGGEGEGERRACEKGEHASETAHPGTSTSTSAGTAASVAESGRGRKRREAGRLLG